MTITRTRWKGSLKCSSSMTALDGKASAGTKSSTSLTSTQSLFWLATSLPFSAASSTWCSNTSTPKSWKASWVSDASLLGSRLFVTFRTPKNFRSSRVPFQSPFRRSLLSSSASCRYMLVTHSWAGVSSGRTFMRLAALVERRSPSSV